MKLTAEELQQKRRDELLKEDPRHYGIRCGISKNRARRPASP
jgi:hypothetical protein